MKRVIAPILEQPDLDALQNCLLFLAKSGTDTLMVVHNPNIGITDARLTADTDRRIADLKAAIQQCKDRDDFTAAQAYKEDLESAQVDRDLKIREGWSNIPEAERRQIYAKTLGDIGTDAIFALRENYSYAEFFRALHELQGTWPKDMPMGEFAVVWPRSIEKQTIPMPAAKKETDPITHAGPATESQRREELSRFFMKLKSVAKSHGLEVTKTNRESVIEQILAKEFPKAA